MIRPRLSLNLRVVVLLLLLSPSASAQTQNSPAASQTPHAAASQAQGADVLWYGHAPPGSGGTVTDMKLLAPGTGWALRPGYLYWTSDNGMHWKDISPRDPVVSGHIFFLNASTGWVVSGEYEPCAPELHVSLDATTDVGATWSQTEISLPLKDYGIPFDSDGGEGSCSLPTGGAKAIAFADHLHGWMNIFFHGQTMNSWMSSLLLTSDGGRTWKRVTNAPELTETQMLCISATDGWLYGDDENEIGWALYVARDGGRSWQQFAPDPPGLEQCEVHGLPIFQDARHGFLPETCVPTKPYEFRRTMVLMATSDGGRTWKLDQSVLRICRRWQSPDRNTARQQLRAPTGFSLPPLIMFQCLPRSAPEPRSTRASIVPHLVLHSR